MLDYAARLTREPSAVTRSDLEDLRRHGFDDGAIHDIAQVTALFNYYNRLADGLGIDLEPEMPPDRRAGRKVRRRRSPPPRGPW